jgi:DNA polymerase elongation subunit (family B)
MVDIETAPHLAAVWGLYEQNVAINQIIKPGYTLSWAAKWHGQSKLYFDSVLSGHEKMIKGIYALLEESDAVCHYNGTKFDIPTLNKEFLLMGLTPPAPSAQIDLLKVARSRFRLASNKLDYVAQQLGLGKKLEHKGFDLWLQCMAKDKKAWKTMEAYNKQDVKLLELVYDRLLPWIKHHPNLSVFNGAPVCPNCASKRSHRRGFEFLRGSKYTRFQCQDCGTWHRDSKSIPQAEKRMPV